MPSYVLEYEEMPKPQRIDNRRELDLAEGVAIRLRPAGFIPRFWARCIDMLAWTIVMSIGQIVLGVLSIVIPSEIAQGFMMLFFFVMLFMYDVLFEASRLGATPGKLALGLKVVKRSGAPVGLKGAFVRVLLFWIDLLPGTGAVGLISVLFSKNSQRLGDRVADTLVVYRREPLMPEVGAIGVPGVAPGVALQREEEVAFLQFAERMSSLSAARQQEVTAALSDIEACEKCETPAHFALGVARTLSGQDA